MKDKNKPMLAILAEHIVAGGEQGEGKSSAAFHELMERGRCLSPKYLMSKENLCYTLFASEQNMRS